MEHGRRKITRGKFLADSDFTVRCARLFKKIITNGFTGLLIYTKEFDAQRLADIQNLLQSKPITDSNNIYAFFDLREYSKIYKISANPTEVFITFREIVLVGTELKYWCIDKGYIQLENTTGKTLQKTLRAKIEYPNGGTQVLKETLSIKLGFSLCRKKYGTPWNLFNSQRCPRLAGLAKIPQFHN